MKLKKSRIVLVGIMLIIATTLTVIAGGNNTTNQENKNNSNTVVSENVISEVEEKNIEDEEINKQFKEGIIGTLTIPKLEVHAEIKEGTEANILETHIGHFENTAIWYGNVVLASHNAGNGVATYFKGIHLLEIGDEIIYNTNMGERRYEVVNYKKILETDWLITDGSKENIINLMTCVTNEPQMRYIVTAAEVL